MSAPVQARRRSRSPRAPREAMRLLSWVWGEQRGMTVLQCLPCAFGHFDDEPVRHAGHLQWPAERAKIVGFIAEHRRHGRIHYSPLLRDEQASNVETSAACIAGQVCWADVDEPLSEQQIVDRLGDVPAVLVASGGAGRYHVYVPLDELHPPEDIRRGNEALKRLFGADSAQAPAKLLAVPGTENHNKRYCGDDGEPAAVELLTSPDDVHRVPLEAVLELAPPTKTTSLTPPRRAATRPPITVDELPGYLWEIIDERPGPKRGGQAYHSVAALMEYGLTDDEIREICPRVPAIAEKYDGRIAEEIDRNLGKLRPLHLHEGESCRDAKCPNTPGWMDQRDAPDWSPAWSYSEFVAQRHEIQWMVEDLVPHPTYGMIGAAPKSLKTWLALELGFAVSSGGDFLDRFPVATTGPVLFYVNEGTDVALRQRLIRLARAKGVEDVPVHIRTNVPACDSRAFMAMLRRDLAEYEPVLLICDPWYAMHGTTTDPSNVTAEGALLRRIQEPCTEAGASLLIVNHFTKAARKLELASITQSGGGEWCDSWILTSKITTTDEDVIIKVMISGRSVGQTEFTVRALGAMLPGPDAPFQWQVHTSTTSFEEAIVELLEEHPHGLNKTQIRDQVTGANTKIDAALKELLKLETLKLENKKYTLSEL